MNVSRILVVLWMSVCLILTPRHVFAYIDPGSGSMAYQVLLTGLLAGALFVRRAIVWISHRFHGRRDGVGALDDTDRSA